MFEPNSLEAVAAAVELGVDLVEFDVRVTRDGRFLTYHDDTIGIDGTRHPIEELTEREALTHAPDAAPVADVLALLAGRARAHVDLKDDRLAVELADACERAVGADGFVLTTSDDASVRAVRETRPDVQIALSLGRAVAGLTWRQAIELRLSEIRPRRRVGESRPTILAMHYWIARAGASRWAAAQGLPVLLWTINDARMLRRVVHDSRYWAYTTDYPRLALRLRG